MPPLKVEVFSDFQTLNSSFDTEIPKNHLSDALNMVRNKDGLWENRKGIVQFGGDVGSGEPIHSLHFWKTSSGSRFLTVGTDTDIYSYAESTAYNNGSYTNRQTITDTGQWEALVYNDIIVLCNGVDDIRSSTDNATFTQRVASATIPKPTFLDVGSDFTIFSGIVADKDKVLFSAAAPTAAPWVYDNVNGIVNVDIGNADTITGMLTLGKNIIVTKSRQTYSIALADFTRVALDWGGGCESNRAIIRTQKNSLFIAGRQGIYDIAKTQIGSNELFGNPESDEISSLYGLVTDYSDINGDFSFNENLAWWNAETSEGRLTFVRNLDYSENVWSYFKGVNADDWTIYEDSDGGYHYLFADAATDKVWELFKGRNDADAPIFSRIAGKRSDFGLPGYKKRVLYVDIYGYISGNAVWKAEIYKDDDRANPKTFTIDKDNFSSIAVAVGGLGSASAGNSPLGGPIGTAGDDLEVKPFYARIPIDEDYEKLQWALFNNQADARVVLRAVVVYYEQQPLDYYDNANIL